MAYAPNIYDWRALCPPINQIFRGGGVAVRGGVTVRGAIIEHPEPGGRGELDLSFAPFASEAANLAASWLVSRLTNGSVMRYKLYNTVQTVKTADLSGPASGGLTWSNGQPWSGGNLWAWNPMAPINAAGLKGSETISVDMSVVGEVLTLGHVFGVSVGGYDFTHIVMDVSYSGTVATVNISPPLRRDVEVTDFIKFRPSMLVQCANAREVMSNYQSGRHMQLNAAKLVEAMV